MAARGYAEGARQEPLTSPGTRIGGRYRVEQRLGAGGMGTVLRVFDESKEQRLALKLLGGPSARRDGAHDRLRFRREFHTMARLVHPRIVEVYEYGIADEVPFYTMELLDGHDLRDLGVVPAERACHLLRDVASALAFLHARRLIHRDVAPRNVRCTSDGRAKLIDFGALATAGAATDIAGTPPLIAPENVRGLPLDHRADLFGLGALSYFLLSGKHAYPARRIEQLEEMWRTRPPPPSTLGKDVPAALDELVMSLLSIDPLGRPGSAAEVMDRLGAIVGIAAKTEVEAARGWLMSASLVGRQREVEALRRRMKKAAAGQGGANVLEAASGRGKSRLLRELALEAQVLGGTILQADSEAAGRGPYGVLHALARALLTQAPDEATEAARQLAPVIARVVPELRDRLGPIKLAQPRGDPAEERLRLQGALADWFCAVAVERPLVLLVDDVQRCDEASAAALVALSHEARTRKMLVIVALRTDEPPVAASAIAALREAGTRIRLRGLSAAEVEELVRGIFGEVPHLARLAAWMQKVAGGSPLHCIELARHLVEKGVIRYVDGAWSVLENPHLEGMPRKLEEAVMTRIVALKPAARALAEALSVHGGELPLSLCVLLGAEVGGESSEGRAGAGVAGDSHPPPDETDEAAVFAALDELVFEEILLGSGESYRFRHDALREALLKGLEPDRRRDLHLRVGHALAGSGAVPEEREAEVGWHLLRGGEEKPGAELLARAGLRLYDAQSFTDAIAPLAAALKVFVASGRSPRDVLPLRHGLLNIGVFVDRNVALEYARPTVAELARYSGMRTALRLSRAMPSLLALLAGLVAAFVGWLFTRPSRRGPAPVEALRLFYTDAVYSGVAYSFSFQLDVVREHVAWLEPLKAFGRSRIPFGAYLLTENLLHMPSYRYGTARVNVQTLLGILEKDKVTPMAERDRRSVTGAIHYIFAIIDACNQNPRCFEAIRTLDELGLRYFEVTANLARIIYHRHRGEEELALEIEKRIDLAIVQAGSMWGPESQLVWLSSLAFGVTRDVLGLRRSIESLTKLVDAGYGLEAVLALARGEYLRERGELAAARKTIEESLASNAQSLDLARPPLLCALAETLLGEREPARAKEVAVAALEAARAPGRDDVTNTIRAERALALAEAAGGDLEGAARRLEEALRAVAPYESPTLTGALHEARARVALLARDREAYAIHRHGAEWSFRATKNPALVARVDKLPETVVLSEPKLADVATIAERTVARAPAALRSSDTLLTVDTVSIVSSEDETAAWVSAMLSGCRGAAERAGRALEVILDASRKAGEDAGGAPAGGKAPRAWLYLLRDGAMNLVAPLFGDEPPDAVIEELNEIGHGDADEVFAPMASDPAYHRLVLTIPRSARGTESRTGSSSATESNQGGRLLVGVALLAAAEPRAPSTKTTHQLALELYDAGDVSAKTMSAPSEEE